MTDNALLPRSWEGGKENTSGEQQQAWPTAGSPMKQPFSGVEPPAPLKPRHHSSSGAQESLCLQPRRCIRETAAGAGGYFPGCGPLSPGAPLLCSPCLLLSPEGTWSPLLLNEKLGDELPGLLRDVLELLVLQVPPAGQDVVQGLGIVVAQEGGQATESVRHGVQGEKPLNTLRLCGDKCLLGSVI